MIYQLDTDHVSVLQRGSTGAAALQANRGWLALADRARTPADRWEAYAQLKANLHYFCGIAVWDYTPAAEAVFARLKGAKLHAGTKDFQITALANDATLLSRNLRDFTRVPGLRVEDWTA